jgi:N-acetylglucosaminyl-diphospho-decaprenol L-rhamnosyltransferase
MISIILVNYNGVQHLRKCIQSLVDNTRNVAYEIILVDNASTDGSKELVQTEFPSVSVIESSVNLGFSTGNNLGAKYAKGSKFLFLNTDTYLLEDSVSVLAKFLDDNSDIGIVGPRLVFDDGSFQLSSGRLPNVGVEFLDKIRYAADRHWHWMFASINDTKASVTKEVGWVTGACLMIRREAFEKVNGFDERMFMYFEDKDLCKRVWDNGWKVNYLPQTSVTHLLGGSSAGKSVDVSKYYRESQLRYYHKHLSPFQQRCLQAYLRLTGKIK